MLATSIRCPMQQRHFKTWSIFGFVVLSLTLPPSQASQKFQSQQSIREAAHDFALTMANTEQNFPSEVEVGRLDSRLRLAACDKPLQAFAPPGGRTLGNTTVGIRCSGVNPWTLYVPVKVAVFRHVVVSARPLGRGAMITAADLKLALRNLATLQPDFLTDPSLAVGNQLQRPLGIDNPLTSSMLVPPRLIRRGERVTLLTRTKGIQVRVTGKALMDGRSGERIRVRNSSSKRIVEGVVTSPGLVLVND